MKTNQTKGSKASGLSFAFIIVLLNCSIFSVAQENKSSFKSEDVKSKVLPLSQRIGHLDQSKAVPSRAHQGAGTLAYQTLLDKHAVTGLNFMHIGHLNPKSSIGHHFHNDTDEMFLILDADCEFTVNGKTTLIPGPVGVPCRSGSSHAVHNPSDKPAMWVNFNVGTLNSVSGGFSRRGVYNYSADYAGGSFDLDDDRVGVKLEKPTFNHTRRLTKDLLRPVAHMNSGKDTVFYRRTLAPSVFNTNWAFVDHLMIPPKASVGRHYHSGVDEVYLVIKGTGRFHVNDENASIVYGDAIPVKAKEIHSIENNSNEPLEFIIYGVALEKGKLDVTDVPLTMMKLQMFFEVDHDKCEAFEKNYTNVYVPALRKQVGYHGSKLIHLFPEKVARQISAAGTKFNYQMELMFDTEEHRQLWTKTREHDAAWSQTVSFVKSYEWRGYDVVGMDQVADPLGSRSLTTENNK